MAAGDVTQQPRTRTIELITAATATNGIPSLSTHGVSLNDFLKGCVAPVTGSLFARSTAGSGTMTYTGRLWGYHSKPAVWMPLGTHATATLKGVINEANAQGEVDADIIRHAEPIQGFGDFERLYLEITAIGGTSTAISAWLCAQLGGV